MESAVLDIVVWVDKAWSDDFGVGIRGWAVTPAQSADEVRIKVDGHEASSVRWLDRPDVRAQYGDDICKHPIGFEAYIPRRNRHEIRIEVSTKDGEVSRNLSFTSQPVSVDEPFEHAGGLFKEFVHKANDRGGRILEIGSRIVSPGSSSKRPFFNDSCEFVGFDYYGDENTDIVGDAHELSRLIRDQRFDAVFSISVLEHLAMPWVFAREVNRVLEMGGLTFHATHFAWPRHEAPWDFWRFSDEGLKVLFSKNLGFEIVSAGLFSPVRLHPDKIERGQEMLPEQFGFAGSAILAKKVADIDSDTLRWDVPTGEATSGTKYPEPKAQT